MESSAIILSGGFSKRLGRDKGLVILASKPLVLHVIDRISNIADEILVVVGNKTQYEIFKDKLGKKAILIIDKEEFQSPLIGAATGFEKAKGKYSYLLPCDTPFISTKILQLLYDLCKGKSAVIPRWPTGYIEPLQAVYKTKPALLAAKQALSQKNMNMQSMIANLKEVRYVSTMLLEQIEPKLETFFNINTIEDLKNAKTLLK